MDHLVHPHLLFVLQACDHRPERPGRVEILRDDLRSRDLNIKRIIELSDQFQNGKRVQQAIIDQCITMREIDIRIQFIQYLKQFFQRYFPPLVSY